MNFFEAMQAMSQGKMVQNTDYNSIILYKRDNIVVMKDSGDFSWSISYCCKQEWNLYQPTVKFKDVPLGHMFQYQKPEMGYGIKVNKVEAPNAVYNVVHLDINKNLEKRPEGLKDDDSEVIYPV